MQLTIAHSAIAPRDSHSAGRCPRRAFTLIELLIVLALIGILASLLLGPVLGVFGGARVTQVTAEISNLDKAIAECKLRLGVEPPSFIVMFEAPGDWSTNATNPLVRRSRAFIQRVWPDYNFSLPQDINADGDSTDTIRLQSTEALVFFLGGNAMLRPTALNPQPLGFSANPVNPFGPGGTRIGPFFEFDTSRLTDIDGDGFPEFKDPIPGQTLPYLYFSSYDGAGYQQFGLNGTPDPAGMPQVDDEILRLGGTTGNDVIASVYMVNDPNWLMATVPPKTTASEYINPRTYQIISPGLDFQFGKGGTYIRGQGLAVKVDAMPVADIYRERTQRQPEFDNITNFSGGAIGEQTVVK
ncbi:MAG: type II secretion system protein [Planctomycetaceae bacterium]